MTYSDSIIRAARNLRNQTRSLCLDAQNDGDDGPLEAWEELDRAFQAADDAVLATARVVRTARRRTHADVEET
jgi:hypothetical protein